jgi:hypothetical protein
MNIKTFMAAAVIALTAACTPSEEAPSVSEAAGPAADAALAAAGNTEADAPRVNSQVCDSQTPTAECDAKPEADSK